MSAPELVSSLWYSSLRTKATCTAVPLVCHFGISPFQSLMEGLPGILPLFPPRVSPLDDGHAHKFCLLPSSLPTFLLCCALFSLSLSLFLMSRGL